MGTLTWGNWLPREAAEADNVSDQRTSRWSGYLIAIVSVIVVTAVLFLIDRELSESNIRTPYILLVSAIAYFYGLGPAILTFVLSLFGFVMFILYPLDLLWLTKMSAADWARLIVLGFSMLVAGLAMATIRGTQRSSRQLAVRMGDSVNRISNLLASITDAFFALDRDWKVLYINPRAEHLCKEKNAIFWARKSKPYSPSPVRWARLCIEN